MCNLVYKNLINTCEESSLLTYLLNNFNKQYNLFNAHIKSAYGDSKIKYLNHHELLSSNFIGYCMVNNKIIIKVQISKQDYNIKNIGNFADPISITSTNLINISDNVKGFVFGTNKGEVYICETSGVNSNYPLAYFQDNNYNSSVLSIINQPINILNRFTNDLFYLWFIYENSIELYYFKIDIMTNYKNKSSIKKVFTFKPDIKKWGKFKIMEVLNSRYGIGSFIAIHYINNSNLVVVPLDIRSILSISEKVRLGEFQLNDAIFQSKTVLNINLNSNDRYIKSFVDQSSVKTSSVSMPGKISNGPGVLSCPFSFSVICNSTRDDINIIKKYNLITAQQRLIDTIIKNGIDSFKNPKLLVTFESNVDNNDLVLNIDGEISCNTNSYNNNGIASFFKGYQEETNSNPSDIGIELWDACVKLKMINCNRLEAIMKTYEKSDKKSDKYHQKLLQRLIVLDTTLESCNFSLIAEYITKTDIDNYHLQDINSIYDWALGDISFSNPTNELPCGSLKLCIETLLKNAIHYDIIDTLLYKEVGSKTRHAQKDVPVSYSIRFHYIINFLNGLKHISIALLDRKRSSYILSSEDEEMFENQFQIIEKDINEINCMLQLCRIMIISCEEPTISLAFLKDRNNTDLRDQTSLEPVIEVENIQHLPDELRQVDGNTLYLELVHQLKTAQLSADQEEFDIAININEDKQNIYNFFLLPLICIRKKSNVKDSLDHSLNARRVIMLFLLDSVLSYYLTVNDASFNYRTTGLNVTTIQITHINSIAFNIGEAFDMPSAYREEVLSLWKIDRSVDLIVAVKSLCGSVILTSDLFHLSVKRLLMCNQLDAAKLLLTHNTNTVLNSELAVIAIAASMTTKETWQKGWCLARQQSKYLSKFYEISSRKKTAVLLCKWSLRNCEITKFLETPMQDEEQEAVIEYLYKLAINDIDSIDMDDTAGNLLLPSPHVDLLVIWLLRINNPFLASEIHMIHCNVVGIDNISARGREQAINSFKNLPSINPSKGRF